MFEVNGVYANRKGRYTVIEMNPPKMQVRYDDGSVAELKIDVQARIWENISADFEAREASRQARRAKSQDIKYFVKTVSVPSLSDLTFAGWAERVVMAPMENPPIKFGDRIIFFLMEGRSFMAVATVTGEPKVENPKDYFYTIDAEEMNFFPIDVDASATKLEHGVHVDSVDLESIPNFRRLRLETETFYEINEDDFELLSELLTEVVEDEEEEEDEDEDLYEEDDDI